MAFRFKDMPKVKEFKTERRSCFKGDDGSRNMAFSEQMTLRMEVTKVEDVRTKMELEKLMDETMKKAKEIIATHEASRRISKTDEDAFTEAWLHSFEEHHKAADDNPSEC